MIINNDLICGDCNDILKTLPDCSVNLIVTDPPYGINYISGHQCVSNRGGHAEIKRSANYFSKIIGDSELPVKWLIDAYRILKNNSAIYIFICWKSWSKLERSCKEAGFNVKNMIVINKSNHGMGDIRMGYSPKHELVLFASKGKHILNFKNFGTGTRISDVMERSVKFSGTHHYHPNEKPLSWIEPFILCSSNKGDIVLDPFMGSGTVIISAQKYDRKYLGIEIDKNFYDIALNRINNVDK